MSETPSSPPLFSQFDRLVLFIELLFFIPVVSVAVTSVDTYWAGIIGLLFLVGLYLTRYDSRYAPGVRQVSQQMGSTELFVFLGGAITGVIILVLLVFGDAITFVNNTMGINLRDYEILPLLLLPFSFAAMAYIPGMYLWAKHSPKSFYKKAKTQRRAHIYSRFSQLAIALQAALLLVHLYNTFSPIDYVTLGLNIESAVEFGFHFIVVLFMTAFFYLPIKIQDFFLHAESANWRGYFQMVFILTCWYLGIDIIF